MSDVADTALGRRVTLTREAHHRDPSREIWTEGQLKRQLEKERFRAGRRGLSFCFVMFDTLDPADDSIWLTVGRAMLDHLRLSDEIGWWDNRLALILTDTDARGAAVAIEKIRRAASEQGVRLIHRMFEYPESPLGEGESRGEATFSGSSAEQQPAGSTAPVEGLNQLFVRGVTPAKRIFDLVSSGVALVVLSPLFLAVALAIKLTDRGPVIFMQRREGRGGKIFTMYKFRTMCVGAEAMQAQLRCFSEQDGPAFKMTRDPRLTRIGSLMRKTCIDELPQLLNVLRGEMSIVGPRPLPVGESLACKTWQRRRLDVLPGLTCSWQAEAARKVTFDDWMRLDLRYARRQSLGEDLRLIFRTVTTLVRAEASV